MDKKELDKIGKDLASKAPGLVRGPIAKSIQEVIDLDFTKDGVSDLLQAINLAEEAIPVLVDLNDAIDFEEAAKALAELPFVKDKDKLAAGLIKLGRLAEQAGALLPKEA